MPSREREREREDKPFPMDMNIYATRKTVAQGMMDIALLTANASQLKHVLRLADAHDYYLISLVLIGTSMTLQIIVGILLVLVGRWNINNRKEQGVANNTNNVVVILIFLITVINVLISAFGDEGVDYEVLSDQSQDTQNDASSSGRHSERSLKMYQNSSST